MTGGELIAHVTLLDKIRKVRHGELTVILFQQGWTRKQQLCSQG